MFKKCIKAFLCLFVMLSIVHYPVNAEENLEGILTSLNIRGLSNGSVNSGETVNFDFTFDEEVVVYNIGITYLVGERLVQDSFWADEYDTLYPAEFGINDDFKYRGDKIDILYYTIEYKYEETEAEDLKVEIYSPYTKVELEDQGFEFEDTFKFYDIDDYSFGIANANVDTTAPAVSNIDIEQIGCEVIFDMDIVETQSGIARFEAIFYNDVNDASINVYLESYQLEDMEDGKIVYNLNENNIYRYWPHGTYELESISVVDCVDNEYYTVDDFSPFNLEVKAEDDIFYSFDVDNIVFKNYLGDDRVYLRKDTGAGEKWIDVYYDDGVSSVALESVYVSTDLVDLSEVGMTSVEHTLTYDDDKQITIDIPVEVVDVIGEIIAYEKGFEVCILYSEFKDSLAFNGNFNTFAENYAFAKLKDGSIVNVPVTCMGMGMASGIDEDGYYTVLMGCGMAYNPKYYYPEDEQETVLHTTYKFHFIDEYHNLVDHNGRILVEYEDRPTKRYPTYNENVNISGLRGTLPSYTEVKAEEVNNLDALFNGDYVAYDINLSTSYGNIQPVDTETVDVEITLPEELRGKEVEVYHVDENGEKHFITTTTASDSVSFEAEHFSTYAVVEKNSKAPSTGDTTNVGGMLAMLIASSYVLIRRKRA